MYRNSKSAHGVQNPVLEPTSSSHTHFVSISLSQFTCFHGCAYTAGIFGVFIKVKLAQLLNES